VPGLPARHQILPIGALLATVVLAGCTSTMPVRTEASLAPRAGEDGGPTLALPETVAVLPSPSGAETGTQGESAVAENVTIPQPAAGRQAGAVPAPIAATAFAGSTPHAGVQVASAAGLAAFPPAPVVAMPETGSGSGSGHGAIDGLIAKYAALYAVPETLVRHVVKRESTFNPHAYNHGHWGLMQIKHATARGMGYEGPANGLLDAETNLKYAVKYLRGAWLVAGGDARRADWLYQTGYYYDAKRKGLLEETGLGIDRRRMHPPSAGAGRSAGPAVSIAPMAGEFPLAGQIDVPATPMTAPVPTFASATPGA
jgi:soluble lytic murein transglycosylase-like protein